MIKKNKKYVIALCIVVVLVSVSTMTLVNKGIIGTTENNKVTVDDVSEKDKDSKNTKEESSKSEEDDKTQENSKTEGNNNADSDNKSEKDPNVVDIGYSTIDGVSVRDKNSPSGNYLGNLRTDDKVEIVEKTSDGWYKIKYGDSYGYTWNSFIRLSSDKIIDNTLNTGLVYKTDNLVVRKKASTKSDIIGNLEKGTSVEIVRATSTNAYKIKYKDSYGYVDGNYIELSKSSKKSNIDAQKRGNLNNFVFVGDSFTHRMAELIKSKNDIKEVYAQSGSRSSYWLDKVDTMPDKNNVDGVIVLIGVNGVDTKDNIKNSKALINELIVKYPDKTIYVQKVFPVGKNFTEFDPVNHNKLIDNYNKELAEFCSTKKNIKIIDTTTGFVDKEGYLTNTTDGLHIDETENERFYQNIFNNIK